ncbi:class I SAM-dependent methyltransferase [Kribbella sp. NPDC006257]|uniref:class I SAM-dependent methyltransferase n=1 Tax=Kribbella sp. NPDC006257 TaxID=3156738 RepID=UPI0033B59345
MITDWSRSDVADSYETYDPIRERTLAHPVMFEQLRLAEPGVRTVLDYGCGTGRTAIRMVREHGMSVIAADPSPGMLKVAEERRLHPKISYQMIGDDGRVDVSENSVDAAISCFLYVWIPEVERVRTILAEIHRTLRPGARYAMLELHPDGPAPMMISEARWPKEAQHGFLRSAGFGNIRCFEPTEAAGANPPYAIYLAEK